MKGLVTLVLKEKNAATEVLTAFDYDLCDWQTL